MARDLASTQKISPSALPPGLAEKNAPRVAQNLVVLVLAEAENTSKRIESYLRNAGHPVRMAWVTDLEDARESLSRGTPDLLICEDCLDAAPITEVVALCAKLCPDLPVLLLAHWQSSCCLIFVLEFSVTSFVWETQLLRLSHCPRWLT